MNLVVDGILLNYHEAGEPDAPAVLLLHGWGATAASFDGLAAALAAAGFRAVALDLPGHGGSQIPPAGWQLQDFARVVAGFAAKAGLTPDLAAVIGHSFGGRVAIKAVAGGLLKPRRLVLLDSAGVKHAASARNQAFKLAAKAGQAVTALPGLARLRTALRRRLYTAAGSADYLDAGPMRQIFVRVINEDLQSAAAAITVPTLLIWGQYDQDTPLADGRLLAAKIPHSKLEVVPGAGHFVYLDAPDVTARYVEEFLK